MKCKSWNIKYNLFYIFHTWRTLLCPHYRRLYFRDRVSWNIEFGCWVVDDYRASSRCTFQLRECVSQLLLSRALPVADRRFANSSRKLKLLYQTTVPLRISPATRESLSWTLSRAWKFHFITKPRNVAEDVYVPVREIACAIFPLKKIVINIWLRKVCERAIGINIAKCFGFDFRYRAWNTTLNEFGDIAYNYFCLFSFCK